MAATGQISEGGKAVAVKVAAMVALERGERTVAEVREVERVVAGVAEVTLAALAGVKTVAVAMVVVMGVERVVVATEAVVQEASMAARSGHLQ